MQATEKLKLGWSPKPGLYHQVYQCTCTHGLCLLQWLICPCSHQLLHLQPGCVPLPCPRTLLAGLFLLFLNTVIFSLLLDHIINNIQICCSKKRSFTHHILPKSPLHHFFSLLPLNPRSVEIAVCVYYPHILLPLHLSPDLLLCLLQSGFHLHHPGKPLWSGVPVTFPCRIPSSDTLSPSRIQLRSTEPIAVLTFFSLESVAICLSFL